MLWVPDLGILVLIVGLMLMGHGARASQLGRHHVKRPIEAQAPGRATRKTGDSREAA